MLRVREQDLNVIRRTAIFSGLLTKVGIYALVRMATSPEFVSVIALLETRYRQPASGRLRSNSMASGPTLQP